MADEPKGKEKEEQPQQQQQQQQQQQEQQKPISAVDLDVTAEIAALEEEEERKKGGEGEEEEPMNAGKKRRMRKYHQTRAHANPLSDHRFPWCPVSPDQMNWHPRYPQHFKEDGTSITGKEVTIADIGCGYGGLTVALGEAYPDKLILGMELRDKVCRFVEHRINIIRKKLAPNHQNISVERANCMKSLPCYFRKGQLEKIFFLFPDPHFKKKNFKRRIINTHLLAEYAYILRPGGLLYTVTDVKELYEWEKEHCNAHPLFELLSAEEMEGDISVPLALNSTDEARKVVREGRDKHIAVFRRVERKKQ